MEWITFKASFVLGIKFKQVLALQPHFLNSIHHYFVVYVVFFQYLAYFSIYLSPMYFSECIAMLIYLF